ncbi:MAG TPA: hypothetical protein VE692_04240, partial [Nitrososphaera sp.]|nr:hypothetical protein [Nitrososphaera sp.]
TAGSCHLAGLVLSHSIASSSLYFDSHLHAENNYTMKAIVIKSPLISEIRCQYLNYYNMYSRGITFAFTDAQPVMLIRPQER